MHGKATACSDKCRSLHRADYSAARKEAGITQEIQRRSYMKNKNARRVAARERLPKKGQPGYERYAAKRSEYYRQYRAELLEKKRLSASQHPEKARERSRRWREQNIERARENSRIYSAKLAAARELVRELETNPGKVIL